MKPYIWRCMRQDEVVVFLRLLGLHKGALLDSVERIPHPSDLGNDTFVVKYHNIRRIEMETKI